MEDQSTISVFLEGVSCDIPESVKNSLPFLSEGKGEIIFILQEGIKYLNAFLRILCNTDPNLKDLHYQQLLQSFLDFSRKKIEDDGNSEDEDSEDEDSEDEDSEDDVESLDDKLNKMSLNDLAPFLREFISMFEINNLSFAIFSSNGEIEFIQSEIQDPNNIFCIFKDGEEINPLYFQEAERRLIFRFLLERDV